MRTQDAIIFVIMRTKILVGLPLSSTGRGNHRLRLEILDPASKLDCTVMANPHLHDELKNSARVVAETLYGPVIGARSVNGAAVFLGTCSKSSILPVCLPRRCRGRIRFTAQAISRS